jgi:hypothetical protein
MEMSQWNSLYNYHILIKTLRKVCSDYHSSKHRTDAQEIPGGWIKYRTDMNPVDVLLIF